MSLKDMEKPEVRLGDWSTLPVFMGKSVGCCGEKGDKPGHPFRGNQWSGGGGERRSELQGAIMDVVDKSLKKLSDVSESQAREYREAIEGVLLTMPEEALSRTKDGLSVPLFFPDADSMRARLGATHEIDPGGRTAGAFDEDTGVLYLDGGTKTLNIQDIYSHELAHAVDSPPTKVSAGEKWKSAWREEINREESPLNKYAKTDESEGFAEFSRFAWQHPQEARTAFPACWKALEEEGLVGRT